MSPIGGRDPVQPGEVPPVIPSTHLDEDLVEDPLGANEEAGLTADPGSTPGSVYKLGESEPEVPTEVPKDRRSAYLMAQSLLSRGRSGLGRAPDSIDVMSVADWLLGETEETIKRVEYRPDAPAPVINTASGYEVIGRQRPTGLEFLYLHPPCGAMEWRNATETLKACVVSGCPQPSARWSVMFKEKNA